ncbi:hypothetical protein BDR26DRAFT_857524 [Obelidium mucronatum]|nr:hypothetical protein BDR26DRAFT_857524 [Obelidium mucronatum]
MLRSSALRKFSNVFYYVSAVMILLFIFYIGFLMIGINKISAYPDATAKAWIFGACDAGLLQFNSYIRRNFKMIHKVCGYLYYSMAIVSIISLLPLCYGGPSDCLFVGPIWLWANYISYKAIINGDVSLHRRMNLRAFGFANAVIWMRPVVAALAQHSLNPEEERKQIGEAMKLVLWFVWALEIICMEYYLYLMDTARVASISLLTGTPLGHTTESGTSAAFFSGKIPFHSVTVQSSEKLTSSVMRLILSVSEKGSFLVTEPGCHIALRATNQVTKKSIIRSYTPITRRHHMESGFIELVIRLVPNGSMSTILKDTSSYTFSVAASSQNEGFVYKPNQSDVLVLVGSGTGITPLINVARAVLQNTRDQTRVKVMFYVRGREDLFLESELKELGEIANHPNNSDDSGAEMDVVGRLVAQTRFSYQIVYHTEMGGVSAAESILQEVNASKESARVVLSGPDRFTKRLDRELKKAKKGLDVFLFGVSDR